MHRFSVRMGTLQYTRGSFLCIIHEISKWVVNESIAWHFLLQFVPSDGDKVEGQ